VLTLLLAAAVSQASVPRVRPLRTPGSGLQPRALVDEHGSVHLVTFHGDPAGGELEYACSRDGGTSFSAPVAVSSVPASAVAIGNVRGAWVALGREGRVHIAWNGPGGRERPAPFYYARLDPGEATFTAARDQSGAHPGLDGGGAVAADTRGNVWLVWHAPGEGEGEAQRRVWVAHSSDDGASFEDARAASEPGSGVCPCCGLGALADQDGGLSILYRRAREGVHRDTVLLSAAAPREPFGARLVDEWTVPACVMSTFALSGGRDGALGAWESEGQVRFARLRAEAPTAAAPPACEAPGEARTRKHPSIACAPDGTVLLAWTEGMGWARGGAAAWQLFDASGAPLAGSAGRCDGVPPWSLVQAVALRDGSFLLFY